MVASRTPDRVRARSLWPLTLSQRRSERLRRVQPTTFEFQARGHAIQITTRVRRSGTSEQRRMNRGSAPNPFDDYLVVPEIHCGHRLPSVRMAGSRVAYTPMRAARSDRCLMG
jgi:hypothetical protein